MEYATTKVCDEQYEENKLSEINNSIQSFTQIVPVFQDWHQSNNVEKANQQNRLKVFLLREWSAQEAEHDQ